MHKMKHQEPLHHEKMKHHEAMKHHDAIKHYAEGGMYKNEVEEPKVAPVGHLEQSMGCSDFKGEAMDIAYGQAGQAGCKSDGSKIISQFKNYGWSE